MMVARHGMPGKCYPAARPVGYGVIGWREAAIVSYGGQTVGLRSHRPYGTGSSGMLSRHFMPGYPRFVPPGQRYARQTFFICVHPRSSAVALCQPSISGSERSGRAKIRSQSNRLTCCSMG